VSEGHLKRNIVVKTVEMRDGEVRRYSGCSQEFCGESLALARGRHIDSQELPRGKRDKT
jgi:hypothetical protein